METPSYSRRKGNLPFFAGTAVLPPMAPEASRKYWVAVKELKLSYTIMGIYSK